jgi:uncharacterized membrane protein
MLIISLLSTAAEVEAPTGFTAVLEDLLKEVALFLKIALEGVAVLIILIAVVHTLRKLSYRLFRDQYRQNQLSILRVELGRALALALEFLLAADVVGTAISPNWGEIGRLAAIAGIRTFLNFALEREIKDLEASTTQMERSEMSFEQR